MSAEGHYCGPRPCPECGETHGCICGHDCMTARDRAESTPEAGGEVGEVAVEAAASALAVAAGWPENDHDSDDPVGWDLAFRVPARRALTAALPHLTPQPDGDVREGLIDRATPLLKSWGVRSSHGDWSDAEAQRHAARDVVADFLASGLVVPVGEVESLRARYVSGYQVLVDEKLAIRADLNRAEAQVAAVRAALMEGGQTHYIRWRNAVRALDTAPASPTTGGGDDD